MERKSYVTSMPDESGALLRASRIIARHGGNIVRASYNRAVDLHMLFLDVEAPREALERIEKELLEIGYIKDKLADTRVIEVLVKIPDRPGALLPVLEILNRHGINISYLNYSSSDEPYQDFKMGLLIEDSGLIKPLLDEISEIYQINIIQCEISEENLDNTVFYIRLANEMQKLLDLDTETTMRFIAESNRILQILQAEGENASKVFDYIRRVAYFVSNHRGDNFRAAVEELHPAEGLTLYSIQPPCGSNTYLFAGGDELVLIDTGYAVYAGEMKRLLRSLVPGFESLPKRIYITHADVDHCGLLSKLEDAEIILNKKSADSLKRQAAGLPDYREKNELSFGYSKISMIVSGYTPPDPSRLTILDTGTPEEHEGFIKIGEMTAGSLSFDILEGAGGHLGGEMIYVSEKAGLIFTGDLLVNIGGFSEELKQFNSLAPYLMKSVNVDSRKATEMRKEIIKIAGDISRSNGRPCIICGGHGPISVLEGDKLTALSDKKG